MKRDEKIVFVDTFLDKYLSNGLSSMPKSEIGLLVFHLLLRRMNIMENQITNFQHD